MSKSTKRASRFHNEHLQNLDHDFLMSFLEVDPEVKAAILSTDPSPYGGQYQPIARERARVLREVETVEDDDIAALTGLYAQIDSWSAEPASIRRPEQTAPVVEVIPVGSKTVRAVPINLVTHTPPAPVSRVNNVKQLPSPRRRRSRKPKMDLAVIAARAQEGYDTWLATRSKYALQWDYMNFELSPPPPPPRTVREARRIETRTMIKYYRINASKSHAREDKKQARMLISQARKSGLQSA